MRRILSAVAVLAILAGCGGGGGGGGGGGFAITQDLADTFYVYSGGPRWSSAAIFYSTDLSTVIGALVGEGLRNQGFTGSVDGATAFDVTLGNDDLDSDGNATNNIIWPASGRGRFEDGGQRFVVDYEIQEVSPVTGSILAVQVEFDGTFERSEPVENAREAMARMIGQ